MRIRRERGFTLIELLIVVAIIGIVAAIAIPNLLNAIDRGKQKRTMADIRSIGTACEEYAVDHQMYPVQDSKAALDSNPDVIKALEPTFIKLLPLKDGWNSKIQYGTAAGGTSYTLESFGRNGADDADLTGATSGFDCDIVFQQGQFTAYPEGIQS